MRRTGISLPMNYVVIGLIVLVTASAILLYFTGNMQTVSRIFEGQFGQSEAELARNSCLNAKTRLCAGDATGTGWADQASYQNMTCADWARTDNIFGSGGESDIPSC